MFRRLPIVVVLFGALPVALLSVAGVVAGWFLGWPEVALGVIGGSGLVTTSGLTGIALGTLLRGPSSAPSAIPEDEEVTTVDAETPAALATVTAVRGLAEQRWGDLEALLERVEPELRAAITLVAEGWREDRRAARERIERLRAAKEDEETQRLKLLDAVRRLSDELAASTRARDAFLSRMSHELRTPLNAILGYAEMLDEDIDDEDLQEDVGRIRSSAANLLGTITAVLDLTQLESGQYVVVPEPVDVGTLAREVGDAVKNEARANRNTLEVRVLAGTRAVLDRRMLHSILFNVLTNACKYTHDGVVKLLVAEVEDRVRIVVADTGIGMTQRQIEAAMTPFSQGDSSTTRRYDGAGLGLSVVHGFVEAMGGTLAIQSRPGEGATVEVELPRSCEGHHPPEADDEHSIEEQPTIFAR